MHSQTLISPVFISSSSSLNAKGSSSLRIPPHPITMNLLDSFKKKKLFLLPQHTIIFYGFLNSAMVVFDFVKYDPHWKKLYNIFILICSGKQIYYKICILYWKKYFNRIWKCSFNISFQIWGGNWKWWKGMEFFKTKICFIFISKVLNLYFKILFLYLESMMMMMTLCLQAVLLSANMKARELKEGAMSILVKPHIFRMF